MKGQNELKPFFKAVIMPAEENWSIREVLKRHYNFSTGLIRQIKNEGTLLLNKESVYFTARVRAWDRVEVILPYKCKVTPEAGYIEIAYEDRDVLVLNKPAGQVVHPRHHYVSGTLANSLAGYLESKGEQPASYLINRLDRGTSGLVLVAKSPLAAVILSEEINSIKKDYLSLTKGNFPVDQGVIDSAIKEPEIGIKRVACAEGKAALTRYKVLRSYKQHTLLRITLESGRTHQIRVHLSSIGHPILGDDLYGSKGEVNRPLLHAFYLEFFHPRTGSICRVTAKLPHDFMEYLKVLTRL